MAPRTKRGEKFKSKPFCATDVFWESQGLYGAPRRKTSSGPSKSIHRNFLRLNLDMRGQNPEVFCCNCNKTGHMSWQYSQPRNVIGNVHAMMRKKKSMSKINFKICQQIDAEPNTSRNERSFSESSESGTSLEKYSARYLNLSSNVGKEGSSDGETFLTVFILPHQR